MLNQQRSTFTSKCKEEWPIYMVAGLWIAGSLIVFIMGCVVFDAYDHLDKDTVSVVCTRSTEEVARSRRGVCYDGSISLPCVYQNQTYQAQLFFPALCADKSVCDLTCKSEESDLNSWVSSISGSFTAHILLDELRGFTVSYDLAMWMSLFVVDIIVNFIIVTMIVCDWSWDC